MNVVDDILGFGIGKEGRIGDVLVGSDGSLGPDIQGTDRDVKEG